MPWSGWRKLAVKGAWFDEQCDYDGPTCYELAIRAPRGGKHRTVHCGQSANENRRMQRYGRDGSHLATIIQSHLNDGWHLNYRGWCCESPEAAQAMERRMLEKFDYDWNIVLNGK